MKEYAVKKWQKLGLLNLVIVALLGVIMRCKIAFEFPFFDQKNLQHAHSHFAFGGWISLMLMVLMIEALGNTVLKKTEKQFNIILVASLVCSYGMLISFSIQGYGLVSIVFASLSVFVSYAFCWRYFFAVKQNKELSGKHWFLASLFFNVLSSIGTFYLGYMMMTKNIDQHRYLAAVYGYLHFQYNGWFLFSCIGLFVNYLYSKNISLIGEKNIFLLFAFSCIPAYGLSILWLDMPAWLYLIIAFAALIQLYGFIKLLATIFRQSIFTKLNLLLIPQVLIIASGVAFAIKIALQSASTIPAINQWAFGFRPIVIAYLHLVLLCLFTFFIIGYSFLKQYFELSRLAKYSTSFFIAGVLLNELLLATQGILSFSYTMIPFINEMLLAAALIIFMSVLLLRLSQYKKAKSG